MVRPRNLFPFDPGSFAAYAPLDWSPAERDIAERKFLRFIEMLEEDAVDRIHLAGAPGMPPREAGDDGEEWRIEWVLYVIHAADRLSGDALASANTLFYAQRLRAAISEKDTLQAAAMSMQLMSAVLHGPHAKEFFELQEAAEARAQHIRDTIGRDAEDLKAARSMCIAVAAAEWEKDSTKRMGEVAAACEKVLRENKAKFKQLSTFPKESTIRTWLKDAGRSGLLEIPEHASKTGRPPKRGI